MNYWNSDHKNWGYWIDFDSQHLNYYCSWSSDGQNYCCETKQLDFGFGKAKCESHLNFWTWRKTCCFSISSAATGRHSGSIDWSGCFEKWAWFSAEFYPLH
ncbi:hypothetical protein F7C95_13605 [Opitutia bacterium ISCC 51]|nr:hypothetical protein F7C95_13605 [Opitutae bacterium ISCC 51]